MQPTTAIHQNPARRATAAALVAIVVVALAAAPWGASLAEQAPTAANNKALAGAKRGTDAAGQGIAHGDSAARSGIARGSEKAASPVRNFGESLGRKLAPGSGGHSAPPPVGPQGNSP